jgi:hypothetical protein
MSLKIYVLLWLTLAMAILTRIQAQPADSIFCASHSCCGSDDATPAGVMISHLHAKKEWMFSYKLMTMNMSGIMSGTQSVNQESVFANYLMAPRNMQMNMGMYGITNRLTTMVMVSYNATSMQMDMFAAGAHHHHAGGSESAGPHQMESSGISDIKIYMLYGLLNKSNHQLLVSGGLSFPTGSILVAGSADDMMYPNVRLPYAMQPGSGTYDILPCINYLYQHKKWTASSQVSATVRTGENAVGYRLGNEYVSNNWVAYQWFSFLSSSLRLEGNIQQSIKGIDHSQYTFNEPSSNTANYGGRKVIGHFGSVFRLNKGFLKNAGFAAEYGVPLYQNVNGVQMKQRQSVTLSLQYGF